MNTSTSHRSLWLALALGLVAGGSIAVYRMRQRERQGLLGPRSFDRWKSEADAEDSALPSDASVAALRPLEGLRGTPVGDSTPVL
jgi:hypothetical protein